MKPRDMDDPGAHICAHDHRIHYLGGGLWVCFSCWTRGVIPRAYSSPVLPPRKKRAAKRRSA